MRSSSKEAGKVNAPLVFAVILTVGATLYSLHELHRISVEHHENDANFVNHQEETVKKEPVMQSQTQTQSSPTTLSLAKSPALSAAASKQRCYSYPNTELWGDVVVWGTSNKVNSEGECCDMCRSHVPKSEEDFRCNVWVWCGDEAKCQGNYKQCWLKHLAHPEASKPSKEGPEVPWTAGTIDVDIKAIPGGTATKKKQLRTYHTVTSAQGAAVHWQARIHYYHWKKQKHACEKAGDCEMGGFTRLLHSGEPDDLMDEIPTMVVDPLPAETVEHSWYIVLNRPYAFVQWVKKQNIPEKYVLMAEPDHVIIRPIPNFMTSEAPAAFPFFYIEPGKKDFQPVTQKFTGKLTKAQFDEIAPIGNSPTFMSLDDMKRAMPVWMNTSIAIFKDQEANKAWGWVQEMYGFTLALWISGIKKVDLYLHMMAQPPWDSNILMAPQKPFHIIHYTYGMDYKLTGEFTPGKYGEWRFDKRSYGGRPIPRHMGDPPKDMKNDLVRLLIDSFNEATAAIPCWDDYSKSGGKLSNGNCTEEPGGFLKVEIAEKLNKSKGAA